MADFGKLFTCCLFGCIAVICGTEFKSKSQHKEVITGHSASLECNVRYLGAFFAIWMKDCRVLTANNLVITSDQRVTIKDRYTLLISNTTLSDEGTYVCQVTSVPVLEQNSKLVVTVPPAVKMVKDEETIQAHLGDKITLSCEASGKPSPKVTWSRQEGQLPENAVVKGNMLTLLKLSHGDGGTYQCTADNSVGNPAMDRVNIDLQYSPHVSTGSVYIHTGLNQIANISCTILAQPQGNFSWLFNGAVVNSSQLRMRENQSYRHVLDLVIDAVQTNDLGIYECRAENEHGSSSASVNLTATPQQPNIVSIKRTNNKSVVQIQWTVLSYTEIHSHRLMLREANSSSWHTDTIQVHSSLVGPNYTYAYNITDLMENAVYKVKVRAENVFGLGEFSTIWTFQTTGDKASVKTAVSSGCLCPRAPTVLLVVLWAVAAVSLHLLL